MAGRGSRPGERRGGRKKGTPNKVGADVQAAARVYTQEAVDTLAHLMRNAESEQARCMAADKLLDRAWGKPTQQIAGDDKNPVHIVVGYREAVLGKLARLARSGSD